MKVKATGKIKITGLIMCVMLFCACILSGCNLVTTDRIAFLNTVVASFTNKETKVKTNIIKKDLISAYNTYGYYYQQYGMDEEASLDATLELLVNRKIMLVTAENMFSEGLSDKEKAYLWQNTLSGLESNFQTYYNTAAGITSSSDSTTSSDARVFNGYTKNAQLTKVNGEFEIVRTQVANKALDDFIFDPDHAYDATKKEDKEIMYANFLSVVNAENAGQYHRQAYNDYLKALRTSEEGLKLSNAADEVFMREIDRIYQINYENYMITKYEETYRNYSELSNISVQDILNSYASQVRASYAQYHIEESSNYASNMQSDSSTIYYYRDGADDTQFFQVAHVLFKFTDEQSAEYKNLQAQFGSSGNGGITDKDTYDRKVSELVSQIKPVVRVKNSAGEYEETSVKADYEQNVYDLARYIKAQVGSKTNAIDKAETFREFIYKYNDDPGMINANNNYTIGVNKAEAEGDEEYKVYSNFVEEFNDAAIALYNGGRGNIGDISEPILSENGIHVLFYVGEIENLFKNITENFALSNDITVDGLSPIEVLNSTRVNIFVDKTYFDVLYDGLVSDRFSSFQALHVNDLRQNYNITHYKSNYDDLLK